MRRKQLSFRKKRKKMNSIIVKEILSYIFIMCAAILIAFVLVVSVGMRTPIIGVSMEPSLYNGQEVLVNRFIYKLMDPKVGDTIAFLPNGNQNSHYYIKRVVAVPGDVVVIKDGALLVNNEPYAEYELDKIADTGILENELTLEADEYFVIGDNINSSEDSRSSNIGPVKKDAIVGKAWFHMASADSNMGLIE